MTLLELLSLLRAHWKLVVAIPVVCALTTAIFCWGFLPNQYTASVSIYALSKNSNTQNTSSQDLSYSELQSSQMLANDFAELAKNRDVMQKTANSLGLSNLDAFNIKVTSSTTSRVMKVEVTGKDPDQAAEVANKFTDQLSDTAVHVMGVEAVNVINDAQVPTKPSGPNRALYTLVALLAGLFIAIAFVVVRDMVNTTVRGDTDIEELLDVPVIGRFPYEKAAR